MKNDQAIDELRRLAFNCAKIRGSGGCDQSRCFQCAYNLHNYVDEKTANIIQANEDAARHHLNEFRQEQVSAYTVPWIFVVGIIIGLIWGCSKCVL